MEGVQGQSPKMNWDKRDLAGEYRSFEAHVEFMFKGPLKTQTKKPSVAI